MANSKKPNSSSEAVDSAVAAFLDRHVDQGKSVLVAYSGGLDSTVLLHSAVLWAHGRKATIAAIHFHHGRSPNADAWASACSTTCQHLGVPIEIVRLKVAQIEGVGFEATARRMRYEALQARGGAVLLGHHADDQAETVLFNMLRGTGMLGLSGIPAVRGLFLRPLLEFQRTDLQAYAAKRDLVWSEDESNACEIHSRNYVRHRILPVMQARFAATSRHLGALAGRARATQELLEDLAEIDAEGEALSLPFPARGLVRLSARRACNLLRSVISRSGLQNPPQPRLEEFVRQLKAHDAGRRPQLRLGKFRVCLLRGQLVLLAVSSDQAD